MAVGTMIARLIAQTGQFHREMDQVKKKLQRTEQVALTGSAAMAAGFAALGVAAGFAGAASIKLAAQWEQSEIAFTTLLRSGERAKEFLGELESFASATPFELPGIMDASRKLLAFGWQAESVIPTMTAVGDAVAALGGGEQEISSVVRALGQMQAKGAVAAQEMTRQLAEVGIPAWDYLAKAIGVTVPEAMAMVERRAVPAAVGISAILEGMTKQFGGAMETQARTLIGIWSTLKDEARAVGRGIGAYLVDTFNIKPILGGIVAALRNMANVIRASENAAEGFRSILRTTFTPETRIAVIALSGAILGTLIPVFKAAAKAIWTATLALKGFMLKGAAIAVTAYLVYKAWSDAGGGIAAVSVFMIRMAAAVVGVFGMLSPAIRSVATQMQAYANSVAAASRPAQAMQEQADDLKRQQDNLAKTGIDAAKAQDALGKSTEEAAKKAAGNVMAFDQVHRLQEQMAETAGAGLDAGAAGSKFVAPDIAMPEISFDLGPLAEMGKSWDRLKASLEAIQPVMEAVGYVISGVIIVKVGLLIAKLAALTAAAFTKASTVALLWQMSTAATLNGVAAQIAAKAALIGKWVALKAAAVTGAATVVAAWASKKAAAVTSAAVQIAAKASIIGKWVSLGAASVTNAAIVVGAWIKTQTGALASVAVQIGAKAALIGKWISLAAAAVANAATIAGAWVLQRTQALVSLASQTPVFITLLGKWAALALAATINAAKMAAAWVIALGPIAWVIAAVAGVAAAIIMNWDTILRATQQVWGAISSWVISVWQNISTQAVALWNGVALYFTTLWQGINTVAIASWSVLAVSLSTTWRNLAALATTLWNGVATFLSGLWVTIGTAATTAWATIAAVLTVIWQGIRQVAVTIWEGIRQAVVMPMTAVTGWLATTWETTRQVLATVWAGISTTAVNSWMTLRTRAGELWEGIRQSVVSPIERVRDWLANTWDNITQTANRAFENLRQSLHNIWENIVRGITDAIERALRPVQRLIDAAARVIDMISSIGQGGQGKGGLVEGGFPKDAAKTQPATTPGGSGGGAGGGGGAGSSYLSGIAHLATGGIVRSPTLAMIGEGRYSEAVVPLKPGMQFGGDNAEAIGAAVYKAMRDAIRVSRIEQGRESERQEISIELDGAKLGRALVPLLRREGQRTGVVVT